MSAITIQQSAIVNFISATTVTIYTVPSNYDYVLLSATLVTLTQTGSGTSPSATIGNSSNTSAYQSTYETVSLSDITISPQLPVLTVIPSGTVITAQFTTNSTYPTHTGYFLLTGYLINANGSDANPTPPPANVFVGYFYTTDQSGNAVSGVVASFALVQTSVDANAWLGSPVQVTSDDTGLVEMNMEPGATYQVWIGLSSPITVPIPVNASSPYLIPEIIYTN